MRLATILTLLIASSCFGQLKVEVTSGYRIEGLKDVNVVDGVVFSSSAPTSSTPIGSIKVDGVRTALLRAYDETGKRVAVKQDGKLQWSWTSPKKIEVEITYADENGDLKGFDTSVEIPGDVEPLPTPAEPANDPEFVKSVRESTRQYVLAMADDWKLTSANIKAGKYKNLVEAANDNKVRDQKTRLLWAESLSRLMQPKLGDGPLKPDADKVFYDLSAAYRGVVK